MLLAVAVSWLGLVLHNVADLPAQSLVSPETLYPTLVYLALTAGYLLGGRAWTWPLLGWAALNLVGGAIVSILPLPILPFHPEQTLRHYSFHVVYGATQLPLILLLTRIVRAGSVGS